MGLGQTRLQFEQARRKMVEEAIVGAGVKDERVIRSMLETPRHEFVPANVRHQAYFDMALPIGDEQTISSPFIVAFMTESIDPQPTDKVLEIGTGSGYQAAVLSPLVRTVYTIEIVRPLGLRAARTLQRLRYDNVVAKVGDGFQGWAEHAPFDKIIVTCSPERVPRPLVQQLREGGLMVIPVGQRYQQTLYLLRKNQGELEAEALRPTLFVPMTGVAEANRQVQPDPKNPRIVNGGFEEKPYDSGFVPGWYYQRQHVWETDRLAPEGGHYITLHNEDPGRKAHLMQGLPLDGGTIRQLEVSARVKHTGTAAGRLREEIPVFVLSFYDENRKDLGVAILGPFLGTQNWHQVRKRVEVPRLAREVIARIGLFGATGEISFDDVRITPVR